MENPDSRTRSSVAHTIAPAPRAMEGWSSFSKPLHRVVHRTLRTNSQPRGSEPEPPMMSFCTPAARNDKSFSSVLYSGSTTCCQFPPPRQVLLLVVLWSACHCRASVHTGLTFRPKPENAG
eukprot:3423553-Rhodomonas_salina.1